MTLNGDRRPVPEGLDAPGFALRRQRPSHNALDHEAVMDSREVLRAWSDGPWPEDDFTLEQNADDLAGHIDEHDADVAYGFSVFVPDESRLLGSLYLDAVAPFADEYRLDEATREKLARYDARVEYWLRRGVDEAFERAFVLAVRAWLRDAWWFERVAFGSRRPMEARRALYRALGLTEETRIVSRDGARVFGFNAEPYTEG